MLDNRHSEKKGEMLAEKVAGDSSLMPLLGLAFWRMKHSFEREVGLGAATWFLLTMLINEDGISQGEVSHRFEVDPSRITRLAQRLEKEGLLSQGAGSGGQPGGEVGRYREGTPLDRE